MRLTEYAFVFEGWQPDGFEIVRSGYSPAVHLGLPFVEFHIDTGDFGVTVRCDPCSCDAEMDGYKLMVRNDLEKAVAKQQRKSDDA